MAIGKIIIYGLLGLVALYGLYHIVDSLVWLIKRGNSSVVKSGLEIGFILIGISLFIGLVVGSVFGDINLFGGGKSGKIDKYDAWVIAQDEVKNRLKAPSTADFCSMSSATVKKNGNTWTVKGYVDAENSFGAKVRNDFTVVITVSEDGGQYIVEECSIY